ncbi:MAG: MFS transporter [Chloroflexota bacterium]
MNLFGFLKPKPTISDRELSAGLRWLTLEGAFSLGFFSITTSGFLAAFALALGANNLQIGILASLPFLMQITQLPAIWLVEKIRRRKAIAVANWFLAQLIWFPIALIPLFMPIPGRGAITMLLVLMAFRGLFAAVCNTAWNGWVRDLVPQTILGRFFSRRLAAATVMGIVFSLGAAVFVDFWREQASGQNVILGYTYVLLFGALFLGLASPMMMSRIPEPLMQPVPGPQPPLWQRLTAPLRDRNFRRLLRFLLFWGFASNLAIPFFAVYMLKWLGLPLSWVIGFSILAQLFNILFLRVWGHYVDRFGSKAVLSLCASLYLLVIFGWIFTTMPERYFLTIPLLVFLHIFAGIANAGVTLTVGTIGLKLAPKGEATTYLAGASLAINLGAGLGPLYGGYLADFFQVRQLNLTFSWADPGRLIELPALSIIGYDFLFLIAFILGVLTLSTLALIREEGEVSREVILESLFYPTREMSRPVSSVPSYNLFSNFPFGYLKRIPIPGLDAVLGVTAYQIAEMARAAASAAVEGRRLTGKLARALESGLDSIWKSREAVTTHGIEITRQAARGAMHVADSDNKPLLVAELVLPVTSGVVEASSRAGVDPLEGILGASQGVLQGAAETGADLGETTARTIEAAREVAAQAGIPERAAVIQAAEGVLTAAEAIGPQAVAEVADALPEEVLSPEVRQIKHER